MTRDLGREGCALSRGRLAWVMLLAFLGAGGAGTTLANEPSPERQRELADAMEASASAPTESLPTASERRTRYGLLKVVEGDPVSHLVFDGEPVPGDALAERYLGLGPVVPLGKDDLVLVQMVSGGTACAAVYAVLIIRDDGLFASDTFGSCSDLVRLTATPDKLVVRVGEEAWFATGQGVTPVSVAVAAAEEQRHEMANASRDLSNVLRPLVQPDNKLYRWCGVLEQADLSEPKASVFLVALGDVTYKFYAVVFDATLVKDLPLRIGAPVCFTGRYFTNTQATTVLGAARTLPTLQVVAADLH